MLAFYVKILLTITLTGELLEKKIIIREVEEEGREGVGEGMMNSIVYNNNKTSSPRMQAVADFVSSIT